MFWLMLIFRGLVRGSLLLAGNRFLRVFSCFVLSCFVLFCFVSFVFLFQLLPFDVVA